MNFARYLAVIETSVAYGRRLDDQAFTQWLELFAPDAVLSIWGKSYVGRAGLEDFLAARPAGPVKHILSAPVIAFEGDDSCLVTVDFVALRPGDNGGLKVAASGRFDDKLRQHEGVWRFVQKTVLPNKGF